MFLLCGLELLFPLIKSKRSSVFKTFPNIVMTILLILTNFLLAGGVSFIGFAVEKYKLGIFQHVGHIQLATLLIFAIIILDFWAAYLPHILMHKIPSMWRFHAIHHSDTMIDVTTAFRQHPGETLWRVFFQILGVLIFGFSLYALVIYLTLSALNAQLEHANICLPQKLDKLLQFVFVTPNMHKLHHSRYQSETDSNYSNIFSIWDRLFGTYREKENYTDIKYGLEYLKKDDFSIRDLLSIIPGVKPK